MREQQGFIMSLLAIALIIALVSLLVLDIGILHRKVEHISIAEALTMSGFWITLAMCFAILIYFGYEYDWWYLADNSTGVKISGRDALSQYLNVYLLGKSLSLDNLFVMALIFESMAIPVSQQQRILLVGLFLTVILHGMLILCGNILLRSFDWMHYLIGAILILSAIKLVGIRKKNVHPLHNPLIKLLSSRYPIDSDTRSQQFFIRKNNKRFMTPLFVSLVLIETADLIYSFDSIPAILSISNEFAIQLSAYVFALLGIRAMYFVLASAIQQLRYLRITIVLLLSLIGIKELLNQLTDISNDVTLLVMGTLLLIGILFSILHKEREPLQGTSPLASGITQIYDVTYAGFRRIFILILGTCVLIAGIIMLVTPGPAVIVIPAGLAILATEFRWARFLLGKFKQKAIQYSKETRAYFQRKKLSKTKLDDEDKK